MALKHATALTAALLLTACGTTPTTPTDTYTPTTRPLPATTITNITQLCDQFTTNQQTLNTAQQTITGTTDTDLTNVANALYSWTNNLTPIMQAAATLNIITKKDAQGWTDYTTQFSAQEVQLLHRQAIITRNTQNGEPRNQQVEEQLQNDVTAFTDASNNWAKTATGYTTATLFAADILDKVNNRCTQQPR